MIRYQLQFPSTRVHPMCSRWRVHRSSLRFPACPPRRGAVAVEFAIVGSVFFMILVAMFEFGRLNVIRHTADNAAYEAARHCMVPGATAAEAQTKAIGIMNVVGTRSTSVTVVPAVITPTTDVITVTVSVPMNRNSLVAARFSANKIIQSSVTLRTERVKRRS